MATEKTTQAKNGKAVRVTKGKGLTIVQKLDKNGNPTDGYVM